MLDEHTTLMTLEKLVDFHARFEKIHPFEDGNGRVGRLILVKECLRLPEPQEEIILKMVERPSLVRIMVSNTPIEVSTIDVFVSQLLINPILRSKVCVAISILCVRFSFGEALIYTHLGSFIFTHSYTSFSIQLLNPV